MTYLECNANKNRNLAERLLESFSLRLRPVDLTFHYHNVDNSTLLIKWNVEKNKLEWMRLTYTVCNIGYVFGTCDERCFALTLPDHKLIHPTFETEQFLNTCNKYVKMFVSFY